MKKAIFIDKDGTLIRDVPYNADPDLIVLEPHAGAALRLFRDQGYLLVMITNQSGIAKGYFKEEQLKGVHDRINELLCDDNVSLDGFFYCPHARESTCSCRKPRPGMLLQAAALLNIDLVQSWMIGDILHDVEAGNRAGCRSLLINNGHETEWEITPAREPTIIARDLLEAAQLIIKSQHHASTVSRIDQ
jgi:histidinol-phosphate phosphatase family protein